MYSEFVEKQTRTCIRDRYLGLLSKYPFSKQDLQVFPEWKSRYRRKRLGIRLLRSDTRGVERVTLEEGGREDEKSVCIQ